VGAEEEVSGDYARRARVEKAGREGRGEKQRDSSGGDGDE